MGVLYLSGLQTFAKGSRTSGGVNEEEEVRESSGDGVVRGIVWDMDV